MHFFFTHPLTPHDIYSIISQKYRSCYEGQYNETFLFRVGIGIFEKVVGKETSNSYETTQSMGLYSPTSHSVN